jgi:DNA-binding CsgD family transcriptional regulator
MRHIAILNLEPHPGKTLPPILSPSLPHVGQAVHVVSLDDGCQSWIAYVTSVDRGAGTYSVTLDGALTPREAQVLILLARGLKRAEIGERLGIKVSTVMQHAHSVYAKLGMKGRDEAAEWAERLGL